MQSKAKLTSCIAGEDENSPYRSTAHTQLHTYACGPTVSYTKERKSYACKNIQECPQGLTLCLCINTHTWRLRWIVDIFMNCSDIIFLNRFLGDLELTILAMLEDREAQDPPICVTPAPGTVVRGVCSHAWLLVWVLGIKIQVPMIVQ